MHVDNDQLFTAAAILIDEGFSVEYAQPNYIELSIAETIAEKGRKYLLKIDKKLSQCKVLSEFKIEPTEKITWTLTSFHDHSKKKGR